MRSGVLMLLSTCRGILGLAIIAGFLSAAGCNTFDRHSSFKALTSEPSLAAIELLKPAMVTDQGATTTFPPGKYKPVYEDEHGFYFEAPRKVLVDDVGVYGFDGGVYIERGKSTPSQWYVIRPNGRRTMGRFKTAPVYKAVQ